MSVSSSSPETTNSVHLALFGHNVEAAEQWQQCMYRRLDSVNDGIALTPIQLSPWPDTEKAAADLTRLCEKVQLYGYAVYEWDHIPEDVPERVSALLQALSLRNSDSGVLQDANGLSLLQDLSGSPQGRFPPYQSTPLKWHTDGYYNDQQEAVRSFTLHCIEPAAQGGALRLMDDSLLVWALMHDDPELIRLLAHPQAMTLPANSDTEGHDRPDRHVAMISPQVDGELSMRFTMRARNIRWRCSATQAAAERAAELIALNSDWHARVRLKRGQGIITRNILHTREAFSDHREQPSRQMLRGRFRQLPVSPESHPTNGG
ncbi:MAG: TauD/TfdA family dioxygenase [Granulosicoccus sp.]|nr:TauD/TfdA family dioxygenase [Granulosicoccus sp.]